MLARRCVQGFGFLDIARFHRVGKGFGAGNEIRSLFGDVGFIGRNRVAEAQQGFTFGCISGGFTFGCISGGFTFDDQFAFRVGQQAAGHVIFARLQVSGHLLAKARRDILSLFHHHYPFEDLPLQRFLAVVLNDELGFTAVDGDAHRLALFVGNGDVNLRHIRRLDRKRRRQQYGNASL
ncbi:hypothetical protein D3C75_467310 [compost metagenome]